MSEKIKELCRLCAKKTEISKDLLDETNKNIIELIQQFTQITVFNYENMPTKVCLDCEEKLVSFQLFVLECYKAQDYLMKLCLSKCENLSIIKVEEAPVGFQIPVVKSEVEDEFTAEEILRNAINNEELIEPYSQDGYRSIGDDDSDYNVDDDVEDDLENLTIATLKELKNKAEQKKEPTEEDLNKLNEILKKPNLKVKDIIKLQCISCRKSLKTWTNLSMHTYKVHESKPIAYCLCGVAIQSKASMYKHLVHHKKESKKLRAKLSEGSEVEQDQTNCKVNEFIDFKCHTCDKSCSSWYTLKKHCEEKHELPPVVQCSCGVTLKSKTVMYKHIQDHKNPNPLSCDKCSKIMRTAEALNKHKLKHVPKSERKFCCHSCDKVFNNKELLKSHEKSHIPIDERKIYNCDICNLKFTTRSSAASHKRVVHEKVKAYVCDLCGYACGTNGELRQHRAIHSDDKPFACRKCSKRFKTYSNLKTHMDTHADTSYECYVCSRVLNSRRTLRKHLLVHEDKCRHACPYCNKAFKRRQTLKVHMYTHTGDKPLSCKWCDERFSYASTLRSHRMRCHPDKMAQSAQTTYSTYNHVNHVPAQDYIKSDLAAIGVTKNEVDVVIQ